MLQEAGQTSCAPDLHREASRGRTFSRRPEGTLQNVGTLEWRQWQGPRATAGGASTATERPATPQWRPGQNARWSGVGGKPSPGSSRRTRTSSPSHENAPRCHIGKKEEEESLMGRQICKAKSRAERGRWSQRDLRWPPWDGRRASSKAIYLYTL